MPRVVSLPFSRLLLAAVAATFTGHALAAGADAGPIVTVSPGEIDRPVEVATACPTFTWGASTGATRIELVVLAVPSMLESNEASGQQEPRVVLRRELPGIASAWTPGRAECLAPGAIYAWSVRRLDAGGAPIDGEAGWAVSRRFAVPTTPTVPSQAEVAAALEVLRRYQTHGEAEAPSTTALEARSLSGRAIEVSGTSAIRGENPAGSGANFGVWGQSASTAGAGLVGINTTSGPDLVLDGVANGQADTAFTQAGVDRPSANAQSFTFQNSSGGGMQLFVGASPVSTAGHLHAGSEITSGVVADARLAATIARDSEILPAVLAGDGAGSTLDADYLDGLHGQNYQRRVAGVCAGGEALQGINADGTVVCRVLNGPPTVSQVIDPLANGVSSPSLAIGADGFPVISYYEMETDSLKVAKCNDAACAGDDETFSVVDNHATNFVGWYSSIAIGTDGFPVVSYQDAHADTLKVVKCNDAACAPGGETITTVDDPANAVGEYTSLAIGADGFPVISYRDATAGSLKVVKCNDPACAPGGETITTVDDPANSVGFYSSLAIGADGRPVIGYHDATAGTLKVVKCNDAACAPGGETVTTVDDPADDVGEYSSLMVGGDGFPVLSYRNATTGGLRVARCNDAACAGGDEKIAVFDDDATTSVISTRIVLGADGLPVASYSDQWKNTLTVAKCNSADCPESTTTLTTVYGATFSLGGDSEIALGADGFPVLVATDGHLIVAKCQTRSCFAP